MSRLEKRVERLEGRRGEGVWVWMRLPADWDEGRRRRVAEATAQEEGYEPPFRFTLEDNWPSQEGVNVMLIGTSADVARLFDYVAKHGKRIGEQGQR